MGEGETENMCVWTKKRGSMNAVVLMATPCPKSLHGKGEKWIARDILQGLDSRQPMPAMTEKKSPGCLDRDTAGDCIGRAGLSGVWLRYPTCMQARGYVCNVRSPGNKIPRR